ncbi:MAG: hydroxyacid dehydrogenase [Puniceicoccales bacterium]
MTRPQSAYFLKPGVLDKIYSPEAQSRIERLTAPLTSQITADNWHQHRDALASVEYLLSGWGMAVMDESLLNSLPNLKHVFYGAGSIREFYTDLARDRGIGISSAWRANAIPTAEFAHATIILCLKQFWRAQRTAKENRIWTKPPHAPGTYRSTVGIISLGAIGRRVAQRLSEGHELNLIAYDPYASDAVSQIPGLRLVSLDELFTASDVISLHAPNLPETRGMISRELLQSMKLHATLINTARGDLIDEPALIQTLLDRPDLEAVLDVTANEYENQNSPLWDLPNVTITPHIAGSLNGECRRMGTIMVEELERLLTGLPLEHSVTPQILARMA